MDSDLQLWSWRHVLSFRWIHSAVLKNDVSTKCYANAWINKIAYNSLNSQAKNCTGNNKMNCTKWSYGSCLLHFSTVRYTCIDFKVSYWYVQYFLNYTVDKLTRHHRYRGNIYMLGETKIFLIIVHYTCFIYNNFLLQKQNVLYPDRYVSNTDMLYKLSYCSGFYQNVYN